MNSKKRKTSVDLTPIAQKIKDEYVDLGLKNILSAGLLLFHIQADPDKLLAIRTANGKTQEVLCTGKQKLQKIRELAHELQEQGKLGMYGADWIGISKEILAILDEPNKDLLESLREVETTRGDVHEAFLQLKRIAAETPAETIRLLSPEERKLVKKINEELGPETKQKDKSQTGS